MKTTKYIQYIYNIYCLCIYILPPQLGIQSIPPGAPQQFLEELNQKWTSILHQSRSYPVNSTSKHLLPRVSQVIHTPKELGPKMANSPKLTIGSSLRGFPSNFQTHPKLKIPSMILLNHHSSQIFHRLSILVPHISIYIYTYPYGSMATF